MVVSITFVSALTNGTVTLAPVGEAETPTTPSLLAAVPRVTVLEQPDAAKSSIPTVSITSVFIMFYYNLVEAVGIEPTSLEPSAQIYYKLNQYCLLRARQVTDKPTGPLKEWLGPT